MLTYKDEANDILITYRVTEGIAADLEGEPKVYGISAEMLYAGEKDFAAVEDAFCSEDDAERFMFLAAENGIEPCQLEEVIQDCIQSF